MVVARHARPWTAPAAGEAPRLPQDEAAERAVLGALLLERDAVAAVRGWLRAEDFADERHRAIYTAALAIAERGERVQLVALHDELAAGGGRTASLDYLGDLTMAPPDTRSVGHYAALVVNAAVRRQLADAGGEVAGLGFDERLSVDQALRRAQELVFGITEQRAANEVSRVGPVLQRVWAEIEDRLGQGETLTGVPTGLATLDTITQGLQPGELVILAARPSVGKSALSLNIARNVAVDARIPVAVFSLEMSKEALAQRLLCSEARVDSFLVRTGQTDATAFRRLAQAMDRLTDAGLWFDDTRDMSLAMLRSRARRMQVERRIGLVVVDYLQLMRATRTESRTVEVSEISSGLKAIAKELQVPVLALSQMSRDSERRADPRPQLSDLRESGSLEQDADVVLFLHRPGMRNRDVDLRETVLMVAKNRNGPVTDIELVFTPEETRFEEAHLPRSS